MSKKTTRTGSSTSSNTLNAVQARQFDPAGLATYQGFQPQIAGVLGDFMSDPWKAGYFQKQLGRANEFIGQQGRTAQQGIMNLARGGTVGNMPAFLQSEMARAGRGTQRAQSNALTNLLLGGSQLRLGAAGQAQGYQPLETGQTTNQTGTSRTDSTETTRTGGLGTWLPQVAGMGLGALTGGFGGGGGFLGGLFGGGGPSMGPYGGGSGVDTSYLAGFGNALLQPQKQRWY